MFGNTRRIAEAVAEGLSGHGQVEVVNVDDALLPLPLDLDLLVIGAPTHAFGMSRPGTRRSAAEQSPDKKVTQVTGVREWIARMVKSGTKVDTAVFDTRFAKPHWMTGAASRGAARRLRRAGLRLRVRPESFFVTATSGPLAQGEWERAHSWGHMLASVTDAIAENKHSAGRR